MIVPSLGVARQRLANQPRYVWKLYLFGSIFDFDPDKSASNREKHGVDFVEAQMLWEDDQRIEVPSSGRHLGEARRLVVGRIWRRFWTAIVTDRNGATRIISVRRARDYEEQAYEQARIDQG